MNKNDFDYKHYKVAIKFEGISEVMIYAKSVDEAEEIAFNTKINISDENIEINRQYTEFDISGNTIEIDPNEYSWCDKFYRSYFPLGRETMNEKLNSIFDC